MNLDLQPILKKLKPLINFVRKDSVGIFLFIVACVFGFLIWRIGSLAGAEPGEDAVAEKLQAVVRPKIDPASIKKIQDLEDQNIDIKAYFSDRNNPFQE